ncbi:endothelin receptor type B-like [Antedon mediterranea]|uniref:endothelin receptor type B-like n=1 Tax=Antedon mediterranea TaxID=105859 RepID=UPI003AF629E0
MDLNTTPPSTDNWTCIEYPGVEPFAVTLHMVQKIVCIFSLISNILVIIIVLGDRKAHTTANLLIVNLAVSQILLLVVRLHSLPLIASDIGMTSLSCKLWRGGMHWSQAATALTICTISLERRRATKSLSRSSNIPQRQLAIGVAFIWVITLAASLRMFIVSDITMRYRPSCDGEPVTTGFCYPDREPGYDIYTYLFQVFFYLIPLIVMSVAYGCVICSLRYTSNGTSLQPSQVKRMIATRRRVSVTVFVISLAFCILWFPYVFLQLIWYVEEFSLGIGMIQILYFIIISEILIEFQGCVNVLTLCFLSQSFRQSMLLYLRFVYNCVTKCRCGCRKSKADVYVRNEPKYTLQSNNDHRATRNTNVTCEQSSQL